MGAVTQPVGGQNADVVTVKALPAPVTLFCDPPPGTADLSALTYTIAVDGGEAGPPQAACRFTISIATAGPHRAAIVAHEKRAGGAVRSSPAATLRFNVELAASPKDARNTKRAPKGKPQDAPFTDPDGHRWTLVGTDVQMDGAHAPQAGPCTRLVLLDGEVYVFGDQRWWRWAPTLSPKWQNVGPELPK